MKWIKIGFIVSITITAPVFLFTPVAIHLFSELVFNSINTDFTGIIIRAALTIFYSVLIIYLYNRIFLCRNSIPEDIKQIHFTISKYIIPSICIGAFYALQKNLILMAEQKFDIEVYIYSDILSRLEKNLAMIMSIILMVIWWSHGKATNSEK